MVGGIYLLGDQLAGYMQIKNPTTPKPADTKLNDLVKNYVSSPVAKPVVVGGSTGASFRGGFYGIDVHDAADDGIHASGQQMTFKGMRMWEIDEFVGPNRESVDPWVNPWGASSQGDLYHNDAIKTGPFSRDWLIEDSWTSLAVIMNQVPVTNMKLNNVWSGGKREMAAAGYSVTNGEISVLSLADQLAFEKSEGKQPKSDKGLNLQGTDLKDANGNITSPGTNITGSVSNFSSIADPNSGVSTIVLGYSGCSSSSFAACKGTYEKYGMSFSNIQQFLPDGITDPFDQLAIRDHPDNPANIWRNQNNYESWPSYFSYVPDNLDVSGSKGSVTGPGFDGGITTPLPTIPPPTSNSINISPNSDFESNPTPNYSSIASDASWATDQYLSSSHSLKLESTNSASIYTDNRWFGSTTNVTAEPNTVYSASVWVRIDSINTGAKLRINFWDSTGTYISGSTTDSTVITGTKNWTLLKIENITSPANTAFVRPEFMLAGSGTAWFDNVYICQNPTSCDSSTLDTVPPVVTLDTPSRQLSISNLNIEVTASDNKKVTKVDHLINGVVVNTSTTSPYGFVWNTRSVTYPNEDYKISVVAYDEAGNQTSSTESTVTVRLPDISRNGTVDISDLTILIAQWGRTDSKVADLNNNGVVDIEDLSIIVSNWGQ